MTFAWLLRMAMLSFLIVDPTVNKDRLMKVCLIHDLAEAVIGDITPYDGISKEEKRRLEEVGISLFYLRMLIISYSLQDALRNIANDIGHAEVSQEIIDLWMEYEEGTSIEADLARQLDKFEMIVQADEYEVSNPGKRLERFFESTVDSFSHPEVNFIYVFIFVAIL